MKTAKVIITIKDAGNGKLEFQCQCQSGQSSTLNDLAQYIAEALPRSVHLAALGFYKTKGSKNAIH